jgi:hypothetical protein
MDAFIIKYDGAAPVQVSASKSTVLSCNRRVELAVAAVASRTASVTRGFFAQKRHKRGCELQAALHDIQTM